MEGTKIKQDEVSKKREYISPRVVMEIISLEHSIAAGSANVSVGGPQDSSQPEIIDQGLDERPFDMEF
ncbi:MAG: hypothetical protein ACI35Z_08235 [Sphingobacterium hotanense]